MSFYRSRRQLLQLAGAMMVPTTVLAQGTSTIRILVGYPAGGTADSISRVISPLLTKRLGAQVIVDNKPGASGQLAAQALLQAPPDGLAVLVTPLNVLTLVPHLYRKPLYDTQRDFTAVGPLCDHAFGLAVPGTSPIKSVAEFITWAKAKPNDASFASPGAGSSPHFLGVVFGRDTGASLNHVPYKGVAPGLQDLIGAQVASTFNPLPTMLEYHKAGRIRVLAVTSPKRVAAIPEVPTFAELKLPALTYTEWYGVFVASKTPEPLVRRLESAVQEAVASPEMASAGRVQEVQPIKGDAASLKQRVEADSKHWVELVKVTGIQLEG